MPGKRATKRPKIKWTYEMNVCLLECRDRAKSLVNSENPPRKDNGRKIGYMELMHNFFLEAFPGVNDVNKQNLRDQISEAERCKYSTKTPLDVIYHSEINSEVNLIECNDDILVRANETTIDYLLNPLNEMECKACETSRTMLQTITSERGEMENREWATRARNTPSLKDLTSVNRIVAIHLKENESLLEENNWNAMWMLNCIVYVSIVAWYLTNGIKCKIKSGAMNDVKHTKARWLIDLENAIFEKRRLISKCVAEMERIKGNLRMTRKTKRNRKGIEKMIGEISLYSLTKLVCKLKAQIHKQSQTRKKKIRNQEARKWNNDFHNNQSKVFRKFKEIIDSDKANEFPKFKECEKTRKFFQNSDDVTKFWKSLWCREDAGNANAEWLNEYTKLFENQIPEVMSGDLIVNVQVVKQAIKKKRNWSAPGPDLIVNFWLKKLDVIHRPISNLFANIINNLSCEVERWYCCGRTNLLEKPGEWTINNTRPITCTNTMYKWFTSLLLLFFNSHREKYSIMQLDQRGGKEKCSGTMENLLIDNMVLMDAHDNKRNLACSWVDVSKAYDSLSHAWIRKMLSIHRFPVKLQVIIGKIMDAWNITLVIPLEDKDVNSEPIDVTNGVLQGDVISGNIYTLSSNPVSWEIRRYEGYQLSKPITTKITHSFFMDDLKNYAKTFNALKIILSDIKEKMKDAGLLWNSKKCKALIIKRGVIDHSIIEMILSDGTKIECLKSEDLYKFLGVPENALHDVRNLVESLTNTIKQRTSVIWSSPLSDFNKVMATNSFVHSVMEYYMWTEKFNLSDLRELDKRVRDVMNKERAKYSLQLNASLYLPRVKGGRGLKHFETLYKKSRVKAAMNILTSSDPRMQCVKRFDLNRMNKGRSSVIKDAVKYGKEDFSITFEPLDSGFTVSVEKDGEITTTSDKNKVKTLLKENETEFLMEEINQSTWQGLIYKLRYNDTLVEKPFTWLTKWKDCPVEIVNEIQSIHLQTIPTLTFQKHRAYPSINSTICRLCKSGNESVKHLLSTCNLFLKTTFKRRHDRALQLILFHFLVKNNLLERCPPWYTRINIKPKYENENVTVLWDIPEYSGFEDEDESHTMRPDGKIIFDFEKKIYVLEMSVPWVENRETKFTEKEDKYKNIIQTLKVDNPEFEVQQLTFIIDGLGGYSPVLKTNLKILNFDTKEIDMIIYGMQKIVLTEAVSIIKQFKIKTIK